MYQRVLNYIYTMYTEYIVLEDNLSVYDILFLLEHIK